MCGDSIGGSRRVRKRTNRSRMRAVGEAVSRLNQPAVRGPIGAMRLREIQDVLDDTFRHLDPISNGQPLPDGKPSMSLKNLGAFRDALARLRTVPPLIPSVSPLFDLAIVKDGRDAFLLPAQQADALAFVGAVQELRRQVTMLKALVDSVVAPESETSMAIEVGAATMTEVSATLSLLDGFFAEFVGLPVGAEDERFAPIEFEGFDLGSTWLILKTKSAATLKFVGWVLRGALWMVDWTRARAAEAKILEAAADDTADAVKYARNLRRLLARQVAESVAKNAAPSATSEEIGKIAVLLGRAEEVIDRRVRIVPSLKAAPSAREAFAPDPPTRGSDLVPTFAEGASTFAGLLREGGDGSGGEK